MTKSSNRRKEIRSSINQLKDRYGCHNCGYKTCLNALQFHHIDPTTKINSISKLISRRSIIRIQEELHKCVILCANCHIEVEMGEAILKRGHPILLIK